MVTLDYLLLGLVGVTIVVSIQAVGIIMVVAMLVTPAATGQLLVDKFWDLVKIAIGVAIVAAVSGLYLSFYLNVASGASIVLVETLMFGLALCSRPSRAGSAADARAPWTCRSRRAEETQPASAASSSASVGIPSRAPARVTASDAATTARRAAIGEIEPGRQAGRQRAVERVAGPDRVDRDDVWRVDRPWPAGRRPGARHRRRG